MSARLVVGGAAFGVPRGGPAFVGGPLPGPPALGEGAPIEAAGAAGVPPLRPLPEDSESSTGGEDTIAGGGPAVGGGPAIAGGPALGGGPAFVGGPATVEIDGGGGGGGPFERPNALPLPLLLPPLSPKALPLPLPPALGGGPAVGGGPAPGGGFAITGVAHRVEPAEMATMAQARSRPARLPARASPRSSDAQRTTALPSPLEESRLVQCRLNDETEARTRQLNQADSLTVIFEMQIKQTAAKRGGRADCCNFSGDQACTAVGTRPWTSHPPSYSSSACRISARSHSRKRFTFGTIRRSRG